MVEHRIFHTRHDREEAGVQCSTASRNRLSAMSAFQNGVGGGRNAFQQAGIKVGQGAQYAGLAQYAGKGPSVSVGGGNALNMNFQRAGRAQVGGGGQGGQGGAQYVSQGPPVSVGGNAFQQAGYQAMAPPQAPPQAPQAPQGGVLMANLNR